MATTQVKCYGLLVTYDVKELPDAIRKLKNFVPRERKANPDAVLVVGDVNSTVACTLVAAKLRVKTIHYPFEFHLRLPFVTWLPGQSYL